MKYTRRYNWPALKAEYITGDIESVSEFLESKGMPRSGPNATKTTGWSTERERYQNQVSSEIITQTAAQVVEHQVDYNLKHLALWDKLYDRIEQLIDSNVPLSPKNLNDLCTAHDKIQKGQRLAAGLDSTADQTREHVAQYLEAIAGTIKNVWQDEESGQ